MEMKEKLLKKNLNKILQTKKKSSDEVEIEMSRNQLMESFKFQFSRKLWKKSFGKLLQTLHFSHH